MGAVAGVERSDLGVEPQLGPGGHRGLGERLGQLAEPLAGVQEDPTLGPAAADQAADDVGGRRGADPATGQLAGQLGGVDAPDLADVGAVELLCDRGPEAGPHHLGEGVGPRVAEGAGGGVPCGAEGEAAGRVAQQVAGAQREAQPAPGQVDATVAGPGLQVVAQQAAQLGQQLRRGGRVQPVAAQVDPQAGDVEAGRHAAHLRRPLDDGDLVAGLGRLPAGPQPGGAGPDHHDAGAPARGHPTGWGWVASVGSRTSGSSPGYTMVSSLVARVRAT
nr:hypothetical protein [Aquihabitans sp. G128]